jgi:glycosyltransferase involved in cell wall biosynthesis
MTAVRTPELYVDVVIPVRDGARFIEACLDSVRAQTLQPNAVIVVDDGSTDETAEILNRYAARWTKLHVIHSEPRGVSHARNLGIAASQAPFVAFLDSDDVWRLEKLERQVSLFAAGTPQLGFVHCACTQVDETGSPVPGAKMYWPSRRGDVLQAMVGEFYPILGSASAVVARRELVVQVGGFDESLTCGEDHDLWLKLAHVSHVDYVPDVLVSLRVHARNSCSQAVAINPELVLFQRLKIWSKWVDRLADSSPVVKAFRREAVVVGVANVLKRNPDFGLYGRLQRSDLKLARRLFKSRLDYFLIASRISMAYERAKSVIARHLIIPNPLLLRCCQRFGKFKGMP